MAKLEQKGQEDARWIVLIVSLAMFAFLVIIAVAYADGNSTSVKVACINNNHTYINGQYKDGGYPQSIEYCGDVSNLGTLITQMRP